MAAMLRRRLFIPLLVTGVAVLALHAGEVPLPLGPKFAVSTQTVLSAAPGDQQLPAVATNGSLSLVVWSDTRSSVGYGDLYASRIGADGAVLDPAGLLVLRNASFRASAVVWNGRTFAIFVGSSSVIFVSPEGEVSVPRALPLTQEYQFVAAAPAPAARVLYVARGVNPAVMILDGSGNAAVPAFLLDDAIGEPQKLLRGGAGDTSFLVLRSFYGRPAQSYVISFDGKVASRTSTNLEIDYNEPVAIAGYTGGFLILRQGLRSGLIERLQLTPSGAYLGVYAALRPSDSAIERWGCCREPFLARSGGRLLAAWVDQRIDQTATSWVAEIADDGSVTDVKRVRDWTGNAFGIAAVRVAGTTRVVTARGLYRGASRLNVMLDDPLTPEAESVLVSGSARRQVNARTAVSDTNSIVVWDELGPDDAHHLLARRFSPEGHPLDAEPIHIAERKSDGWAGPPTVDVVSNGTTYLILWNDTGLVARRLSAANGEWLDAEPQTIANSGVPFAATASESEALVVWSEPCGGLERCVKGASMPFTGSRTATREIARSQKFPSALAAASDGGDFLVSWFEGSGACVIGICPPPPPSDVVVSRVGRGGIPLDPTPIVVAHDKTTMADITVAWDGRRYVVAWAGDSTVRGVRVTNEGAVTEQEPSGDGTLLSGSPSTVQPVLVKYGDALLLLRRERDASGLEDRVQLRAIPATAALTEFVSANDMVLFESAVPTSLDAASRGRMLQIAYTRESRPADGRVGRAFFRTALLAGPKRRVAPH